MNKEHVKNIILTVLVVMNLVLGSNILFNKKLWPSGYNFFNIESFSFINPFKGRDENKHDLKKSVSLIMPEKIIFNTGDQTTRLSVNSNNKEYSTIIEECNDILHSALSAGNSKISKVSDEEWFSLLLSNSVYLSYYTEYETELFANFLGIKETVMSEYIGSFSNVVISLSDDVSVYIEDSEKKEYYKINTLEGFDDFKMVASEIISGQKSDSYGAINYSFDLKFDIPFGEQKTIINSMVPIYSESQTVPVVFSEAVLFNEEKIDNLAVAEIAHLFNVNSNTVNRYTDADGTVVYVANNATLKIYANGMITYTASDDGIKITGSDSNYAYLNELVDRVNNAAGCNSEIYLSSGAFKGEKIITFDYICEGLPVKMSIDGAENAVYCVISDGHLKEYRHIIRDYKKTEQYILTPEYITALDRTIQEYSDVNDEITINKLYLAYYDNGEEVSMAADWNADVKAVVLEEEEWYELE